MRKSQLRLTMEPDDEFTVELHAEVTSSAFSGRGSAWFNPLQVRQTFVPALKAYPLPSDNPPTLVGGYGSRDDARGLPDHGYLRVIVRPHGLRGSLLVLTEIATAMQSGADDDLQQACTTRFLTSYMALDEFAATLDRLLDGKCDEAILSEVAF
jgi:hypothetical protein